MIAVYSGISGAMLRKFIGVVLCLAAIEDANAGYRILPNPQRLTLLPAAFAVLNPIRVEYPFSRSHAMTVDTYTVYVDDVGQVWLRVRQASGWGGGVDYRLIKAGPGKNKFELQEEEPARAIPEKLKNMQPVRLDLKWRDCEAPEHQCGFDEKHGYLFALGTNPAFPVILEYVDLSSLQEAVRSGRPARLPATLQLPAGLAAEFGFDRTLRQVLSNARTDVDVDNVLAVAKAAGITDLLDAKNSAGEIPLQEATAHARTAVADALTRAGAKPCPYDPSTPVQSSEVPAPFQMTAVAAARSGDSACLEYMIGRGMSPDTPDRRAFRWGAFGMTLLAHAIVSQRWTTVAQLKRLGATTLFVGHLDLRVDLVNAFESAVLAGNYRVVGEMLKLDPDLVNQCVVRDFITHCPLDKAAQANDRGMFTLLLAVPVDVRRATGHKNYLATAASNDWIDIAWMLLARGFNDETTVEGKRALDFAKSIEMQALLTAHGKTKGPGMPTLDEALTRLVHP